MFPLQPDSFRKRLLARQRVRSARLAKTSNQHVVPGLETKDEQAELVLLQFHEQFFQVAQLLSGSNIDQRNRNPKEFYGRPFQAETVILGVLFPALQPHRKIQGLVTARCRDTEELLDVYNA